MPRKKKCTQINKTPLFRSNRRENLVRLNSVGESSAIFIQKRATAAFPTVCWFNIRNSLWQLTAVTTTTMSIRLVQPRLTSVFPSKFGHFLTFVGFRHNLTWKRVHQRRVYLKCFGWRWRCSEKLLALGIVSSVLGKSFEEGGKIGGKSFPLLPG